LLKLSRGVAVLRHHRFLALAAAVTGLGLGVPAAAQAQGASEQTVTATGTGEVRPTPSDRNDNDAIRRAVAAARQEAVPLAVASARRRAVELGFATGLHVGATLSVAEVQSPFYGPFPGSEPGTFGPGRFCGNIPRFRTRRDASGRIVSRRRIGTRRTCRVPSRVFVSLSVTYAATPKS
jgi:hypothetical protein